ncbi:flavin reductase family protein [Nonomuraea aridisoli]|uniref:Flavin reductase n=1 Tax=Nonomuraea aridisoli TaxID=2070368 RepID=A0A2W2EVP4_9ACTN|nr:flavin reductase family protein [Nonomuraea aridisoli]PZG16528.1 flavin reductase [Nonomuraea aridisoli]
MSTRAARTGKADGCRGIPVPRRRRTRRGAVLPPLRTSVAGPAASEAGRPDDRLERRPDGRTDGVVEGRRFREVLGTFATGVVAITAVDPRDGRPCGLAVNSFTSVSLDPPLVAFCVAHTSTSWPRVRGAGVVTVNVLADGQRDVCAQLASRGGDKFAGLSWTGSPGGNPVLGDALAWLDCAIEAEHAAGDHTIVVARVLRLAALADGEPLVFFRGAYGSFTAAQPEPVLPEPAPAC